MPGQTNILVIDDSESFPKMGGLFSLLRMGKRGWRRFKPDPRALT